MKRIITISREYGSGGRTIGEIVAKKLGYSFYDKEIIDMTAKKSGFAPEFIEKTEQNISSSWLYNMMLGSSYAIGTAGAPPGTSNPILPLADQIFNAQRDAILQIAKKENCVVVGRCADYILATSNEIIQKDILNVFIYADLESRINRAVKEYGLPPSEAKKIVIRIDKRRANHYNTFTENNWGSRRNYDLMINSAFLGLNGTADIIVTMAQAD
jgi:cytidylate kinase